MTTISFTHTPENITVIVDGKPVTVPRHSVQYNGLREALLQDNWEEAVRAQLTAAGSLQQWIGDTEFTVVTQGSYSRIMYKGQEVPQSINERIWRMANAGESPLPLFRFYEKLMQNPSYRSVQQLFPFLSHTNIPIEADGTFLTYKSVRPEDMKDIHSGTFDNSPGMTHEMPRNQISDDPDVACHVGFHVGALSYVQEFGGRDAIRVICRVDPADVVCVPHDCSMQKIRVCKYVVIGFATEQPMPGTTVERGFVPVEGTINGGDESDDDGVDLGTVDDDDVDDDLDLGTADDDEDDEDDDDDDDDDVFAESPVGPTEYAATMASLPKATKKRTRAKSSAQALAAKFRRMRKQSPKQLMECSIDDLRAYASKLKIVGASKLPGGKTALTTAILKYRRRGR